MGLVLRRWAVGNGVVDFLCRAGLVLLLLGSASVGLLGMGNVNCESLFGTNIHLLCFFLLMSSRIGVVVIWEFLPISHPGSDHVKCQVSSVTTSPTPGLTRVST